MVCLTISINFAMEKNIDILVEELDSIRVYEKEVSH